MRFTTDTSRPWAPSHSYLHAPAKNEGMALVVILAALVLATIILTAFMAQTTLSRQVSLSSAGQNRAETVAKTALETVLGDLRTEIVAGSTLYSTNGVDIYIPLKNMTAVPSKVGADGSPNVVKRSTSGSNFWQGSSYLNAIASPVRAAVGSSTTNVSGNGRAITLSRWNATYLLGTNIPSGFTPPDWILVDRQGAMTNGSALPDMATLSNPDEDNFQYVVGRFSYMIYNEGGLLDINVAGHPDGVSSDFKARRTSLPQVDLGKIPGVTAADALVKWRNQKTALTVASYTNHVLSMTNGFMQVEPGDQSFVSRQDLIKYAQSNPSQLALDALQYLGTFSREVNAPTYTPDPGRNRTKGGEGYRRGGGAEQDDTFNPSLINVRATSEFDRFSDQTKAKIGEPLIKHRFPLNRLSWLGRTGPEGATADQVEEAFGLEYSGGVWIYTADISNRIRTLAEVAEVGREPNFFELLQAGITAGSLGKAAGDGSSLVAALDSNIYSQVAQIVANLIDQYDQDSFPTRLQLGGIEFSGIENLPYLTRVFSTPSRYPQPTPTTYSNKTGVWFQPEVWNPSAHSPTGAGPSSFRFIVTGKAYAAFGGIVPLIPSATNEFLNPTGIMFSTTGHSFSEPAILSTAVGATAALGSKDELKNGASTMVLGIWIGEIESNLSFNSLYAGSAVPDPSVNFELQYLEGGNWVTYDRIRNSTCKMDFRVDNTPYQHFKIPYQKIYMIRSDPWSDRFGVGISSDDTVPGQTVRPTASVGANSWKLKPASGWTLGLYSSSSPSVYSGLLSENKSTTQNRYEDPDGVVRPAAGAYTTGSIPSGYPMVPANADSRPLILNRPFRSVGEMGYASRGMPWKGLDFFTKESGDAALLDLFCINAAPALISGRVDLNTQQQPVLEAVIAGAIKVDEADGEVSDADAAALAQSLSGFTAGTGTGQGPLQNRAELVTRWIGTLPSGSADEIIKRRREAPIRALSDIGNVRTWNLLIDVIAQSGRYLKNADNINQFTVEGERRYWLHVAIDRYTGKVVSRQLEPVFE